MFVNRDMISKVSYYNRKILTNILYDKFLSVFEWISNMEFSCLLKSGHYKNSIIVFCIIFNWRTFHYFSPDFQTNHSWLQLKKVMKNQSIKNYTQHLCFILLLVQNDFGPTKSFWSGTNLLDFSRPIFIIRTCPKWFGPIQNKLDLSKTIGIQPK